MRQNCRLPESLLWNLGVDEMGYTDSLKNLLRPLCVYDLDTGYGCSELETQGAALDACCGAGETLEREGLLPTAENYGLNAYSEILPWIPAQTDIAARRSALMALLRIDDASFTEPILNTILTGCGTKANVTETSIWYTVCVRFPGIAGVPPMFEELKQRIEAILPCHLNVIYEFDFIKWMELEEWFSTWQVLENTGFSWGELEAYRGGVVA